MESLDKISYIAAFKKFTNFVGDYTGFSNELPKDISIHTAGCPGFLSPYVAKVLSKKSGITGIGKIEAYIELLM